MPKVEGDIRLLQEILMGEDETGWRMVIGCVLLNLTTRAKVDEVWPSLFERCADANKMVLTNYSELVELMRPLGLQTRRANTLVRFSEEWIARDEAERDLHMERMGFYGCGEYARDSWVIFRRQQVPQWEVADKELRRFLQENVQLVGIQEYDDDHLREALQWRCDHPDGKVSAEEQRAMAEYAAETQGRIA
jgi:hypothetical protein